ncbi:MAG: S-methyl-5-thioribose-1-phosphate isomerase [Bacteroidales bacterium]|nr:S-methyl-5-thioribose-1-phosphate isomerase [Bacteroidales bacterium]
MKVNGKDYRTVWMEGSSVFTIEQNLLPFEFRIFVSGSYTETCRAIRTMIIRGAGAIGAAAGYAMAQACLEAPAGREESFLFNARREIESTRPTARNLFYAVERVFEAAKVSAEQAITEAQAIADEDAMASQKIGEFGKELIRDGYGIATHCNAGWLAFVDYGTALSPIYMSHKEGKNIFIYVDETRPRGQGARLTAWELHNAGIPHAIIPDNATAWYMSQGKINLMIVGADRIAANGDTANKIGTLEKAIAAKYYNIPFYVAAPTSTIDFNCPDSSDIVIEERSQDEVLYQDGMTKEGIKERILVCSPGSGALNPAFDITPVELITAFITEKGIVRSNDLSLVIG